MGHTNEITKEEWDILIENHYINACNDYPEYEKNHSRIEMKEYWMKMVNNDKIDKNELKSMLEYNSIPIKDRGWFFHFGA